MKIKKVTFDTFCTWEWEIEEDKNHCSICSTCFESPCKDCKISGYECPPVEGECSHLFHKHCLDEWFRSIKDDTKTCALCRSEFKIKVNYEINY